MSGSIQKVMQEWRERLLTRGVDGSPPDLILHSWTRSHAAGLDPASGSLAVRRIPHRALTELLEENALLVAAARPHLETLSAQTPVPHVAYLACVDGIVLDALGNDPEQMRALGLEPGCDWSERAMGTNGAGTAIATGVPVTIFGQDHYLKPLKGFVCTAAPVRHPDGTIAGAVDLSTAVADGRPDHLLRAIRTATAIEQDLRHAAQ